MSDPPDNDRLPPPDQPAFNVPPVTLAYFLLLAGVFALIQLNPGGIDWRVVGWLALVPSRVAGLAAADPVSLDMVLALLPLAGHALLHLDWLHFAVNVGFLLAFGAVAERAYGRPRYLLLLVVAAVAGGLAELLFSWGERLLILGASGAVWGCFAAYARLMWAHPDPRRRRAGWRLVAVMAGLNIVFGLFGGVLLGSGAGIAWIAHFGGFAGGLMVAWRLPPWVLLPGRIRRKSRPEGLS